MFYALTVYRSDDGSMSRIGPVVFAANALNRASRIVGVSVDSRAHVYRSRVRVFDGESLVERGKRDGWFVFESSGSVRVFVHPDDVGNGDALAAIRDHLEIDPVST